MIYHKRFMRRRAGTCQHVYLVNMFLRPSTASLTQQLHHVRHVMLLEFPLKTLEYKHYKGLSYSLQYFSILNLDLTWNCLLSLVPSLSKLLNHLPFTSLKFSTEELKQTCRETMWSRIFVIVSYNLNRF